MTFALFLTHLSTYGQDVDLPYSQDAYHSIDRWRILSANESGLHTSLRFYDLQDVSTLIEATETVGPNALDQVRISRLSNLCRKSKDLAPREVEPASFWSKFYSNPAFLFSKYESSYFLRINPLIAFDLGKSDQKDDLLFTNSRGVEVSGGLNDRFFFYTNIVETQARFPLYVDNRINETEAIPGNGFYKPYNSSIFNFEDGYDFLNSEGYLSVSVTDNVGFQLGHGKRFLGNGRRSMLLSDFSNNAFYLQADWKFWKIHYRNLWSELRPRSAVFGGNDSQEPRKYMASHHLSINILPTLNIGLFESVVFHRSDQFELGYLNPIILFRTIEQSVNSPDNVLLGIDARWDIWRRISLYGQIFFDEFKLDELILDNQGWWANKYGLQLGALYVDAFGLPNLDIRAEFNHARPYTYTHRDSTASYTHYNMPLAHPLGANFREWLMEINYPINENLRLQAIWISYEKGLDEGTDNWGGNILLPNTTRKREYDNVTGQGLNTKVNLLNFNISYRLFDGLEAAARFSMRDLQNNILEENEMIYGIGLHYNLSRPRLEF